MNKRLTTRQRMERMVKRETNGICTCSREQAVDLLLKEHRRVRAKVRRLKDYAEPFDMKRRAFYLDVIDDVLKAMR